MLYATVRQRKIYVKRPETVIQNGVNVDDLILEMDDEWAAMDTIVAVFTLNYTDEGEKVIAKEVLHTFGQPIRVPWECVSYTGQLSVSCTGYIGDEKVMTTMYPESFWRVVRSGPVTGDTPLEPTPTLYEQILSAYSKANEAAENAENVAEQLMQDKANGVFDGEPGPKGAPGPKGDRGERGLQGIPGKDGITPHIGANGNWYLGETDTGVKAQGEDGEDYVLTEDDKRHIATLAAALVDVPEGSAGGGYVAQDTAPEDTTLLWVDTSDDSDDDYQEAVNAALAQAKASGEFDGKDGDPGAPGKDGDDYVLTDTDRAEIAEQAAQMVIDGAPVKSVNGKTGAVTLAATDVGARPSTWTPSATDVGADPKGTSNTAVTTHNVATDAHNDLRLLIDGLTSRLNALANSTDEELDQMAEMVAYIKENRELISGITTNKVNVADIINNLTTNVTNKPLSAAQGVALKALIDAITVPTKLSELTNDMGYIIRYTETDPTVPSWAKAASKPSYSKSEVGLGNVDNVKQYSASNPPPYPVTSVNGKTGAVTVDVPSVPSWAMATSKPSYTASEVGAVPTSRTVNGKALSANISLSASDVGARASTWTPSAAEIKSALGYTPANQATTITITGKDADGNTHTFTVVGWEA